MFKFNLNDRVFVKSIGKEGRIASIFTTLTADTYTSEYEISYDIPNHNVYTDYPVSEYLGTKQVLISVDESDLQSCDDMLAYLKKETEKELEKIDKIHVPDAIRYMFGSFPRTATIAELDVASGYMAASCQHTWKTYDSGFSKYEYCSICDIKK